MTGQAVCKYVGDDISTTGSNGIHWQENWFSVTKNTPQPIDGGFVYDIGNQA